MIAVDRNRKDSQGKPIKPNAAWFALAKDSTKLAKQEGPAHQVKASVYGHVEVRKALEELFWRKCAYCEVRLPQTGWDVEHYRPKKGVTESPSHPGYFWLAYSWENFVTACTDCNQSRRHPPSWSDPDIGVAAGKMNQFPLRDENKRAKKPGDSLTKEEPLLLNPCDDDPALEFKFNPVGEVIETGASDRLLATLKICNLQRKRLRDERSRRAAVVLELLETIRVAREEGNQRIETRLKTLLEKEFLADSCVHAAVARDVVRDPTRFVILNPIP